MEEVMAMVARLTGDGSGYQKMMQDAQVATDRMVRVVQNANAKIKEIGGAMEGFASNVMGSLKIFGANISLGDAMEKFGEFERVQMRLKGAIELNKAPVEETIKDYDDYANSIANVTTYTRGAIFKLLELAEGFNLTGERAKNAVTNSIAFAALRGTRPEDMLPPIVQMQAGNAELIRRRLQLRGVKDETELLKRMQDRAQMGWKMLTEQSKGTAAQMTKLKQSFEGLIVEVGGMVATAISPAVQGLRSMVLWFKALDQPTKIMTASFVGLMSVIAFGLTGPVGMVVKAFLSLGKVMFGPVLMVKGLIGLMGALAGSLVMVGPPLQFAFHLLALLPRAINFGAFGLAIKSVAGLGVSLLGLIPAMRIIRGAATGVWFGIRAMGLGFAIAALSVKGLIAVFGNFSLLSMMFFSRNPLTVFGRMLADSFRFAARPVAALMTMLRGVPAIFIPLQFMVRSLGAGFVLLGGGIGTTFNFFKRLFSFIKVFGVLQGSLNFLRYTFSGLGTAVGAFFMAFRPIAMIANAFMRLRFTFALLGPMRGLVLLLGQAFSAVGLAVKGALSTVGLFALSFRPIAGLVNMFMRLRFTFLLLGPMRGITLLLAQAWNFLLIPVRAMQFALQSAFLAFKPLTAVFGMFRGSVMAIGIALRPLGLVFMGLFTGASSLFTFLKGGAVAVFGFLGSAVRGVMGVFTSLGGVWLAIRPIFVGLGTAILAVMEYLNPVKLLLLVNWSGLLSGGLGLLRSGFVGLFTVVRPLMMLFSILFSPITIGIAVVAIAMAIFATKMGSWGKAWDYLRDRAVNAWEWIKTNGVIAWEYVLEKAQAFWKWSGPIRDALVGLWDEAWNRIKDGAFWLWGMAKVAFAGLKDAVLWVFGKITGDSKITWDKVREKIIDTIWFGEFVFKNFGKVMDLVWTTAELGAVKFGNILYHFFTSDMPTMAAYFKDNWFDMFKTVTSYSQNFHNNLLINMKNFVIHSKELQDPNSGVTLESIWVPLFRGAENSIKQMPKLKERVKGELEKALEELKNLQQTELGDMAEAFRGKKWWEAKIKIGVDWLADQFREDKVKAMEDKAIKVGEDLSSGLGKGMRTGRHEALLMGTAKAIEAIQEQRDHMANDALSTTPFKVDTLRDSRLPTNWYGAPDTGEKMKERPPEWTKNEEEIGQQIGQWMEEERIQSAFLETIADLLKQSLEQNDKTGAGIVLESLNLVGF